VYTSSFTLNIAPALDITDSRVVYVIKGYKFIYGENIVVTGGRKPFRYVLSARVPTADSALCSTIRTRMRRLPLPCPRGSCDACALLLRWRVAPFSGHVNVLGGPVLQGPCTHLLSHSRTPPQIHRYFYEGVLPPGLRLDRVGDGPKITGNPTETGR
jgi:hypothetical protein